MKSGLVSKLTSVLKNAMEKLSRYDEGTMFGSILGAMVSWGFVRRTQNVCEMTTLDLSYAVTVKSTVQILQNFVAFSEYMNFITICEGYF